MRLNKDTKAKITSVRFDSLGDLLETKPSTLHNQRILDGLASEWRSSWIGTRARGKRGGEEVIHNALYGNPDILRVMEAMRERLGRFTNKEPLHSEVKLQKRRRKRVRREQGDELDIHKVYQGQLDRAWTTREHVEMDMTQNLFTVFVDVGGLAGVGYEESLWRGVVATQIADDLIRAGKSVKIIVGASATGVDERARDVIVTTDIVVKNYNEPLSMERLAAMANIGFHRVFNFMSRCYIDGQCSHSMGRTSDHLRKRGPIEDTGVPQDISKYIYVGRSTSLQGAVQNLREIYAGLKQ